MENFITSSRRWTRRRPTVDWYYEKRIEIVQMSGKPYRSRSHSTPNSSELSRDFSRLQDTEEDEFEMYRRAGGGKDFGFLPYSRSEAGGDDEDKDEDEDDDEEEAKEELHNENEEDPEAGAKAENGDEETEEEKGKVFNGSGKNTPRTSTSDEEVQDDLQRLKLAGGKSHRRESVESRKSTGSARKEGFGLHSISSGVMRKLFESHRSSEIFRRTQKQLRAIYQNHRAKSEK